MSLPLRSWLRASFSILWNNTAPIVQTRCLNVTPVLWSDKDEANIPENGEEEADESTKKGKRKVVDAETSVRYLNSKAFVKGYGDKPVWFHYRRNFKGQIPPKTRKSCVIKGEIKTGSPCPICRDEYLVLDFKNVKLLEQFISPYTGEVYDTKLTGLCQRQHRLLVVEVMKAWDEGLIEIKLPFRHYDYDEYKN